jgi:hypothetical protein
MIWHDFCPICQLYCGGSCRSRGWTSQQVRNAPTTPRADPSVCNAPDRAVARLETVERAGAIGRHSTGKHGETPIIWPKQPKFCGKDRQEGLAKPEVSRVFL